MISAGHARALLSLDDPQAQERLAQRIVAEGLSVRSVEEIVALGDDEPEKQPRKPATAKPVAPALRHLSDRLSDLFETRVKVEMGRNKGKITVEFATIDDLERIVKAMSPDADSAGAPPTSARARRRTSEPAEHAPWTARYDRVAGLAVRRR